jgi:hypothetical protein
MEIFSETARAKVKYVFASAMENLTEDERKLLPDTGEVGLVHYDDEYFGVTFAGIVVAIIHKYYTLDDTYPLATKGGGKFTAAEDLPDTLPDDWVG